MLLVQLTQLDFSFTPQKHTHTHIHYFANIISKKKLKGTIVLSYLPPHPILLPFLTVANIFQVFEVRHNFTTLPLQNLYKDKRGYKVG